MKKFLIFVGIVGTSFLFSSLVYGGYREDARLMLDDRIWCLGYDNTKYDSKEIKRTTNTSSSNNKMMQRSSTNSVQRTNETNQNRINRKIIENHDPGSANYHGSPVR